MRFLRAQYGKFLSAGIVFTVVGLAIYGSPFLWAVGAALLVIGITGFISRWRLG